MYIKSIGFSIGCDVVYLELELTSGFTALLSRCLYKLTFNLLTTVAIVCFCSQSTVGVIVRVEKDGFQVYHSCA